MDSMRVSVIRRTQRGKGVARTLRRADKIPAVVYGGGGEAISLALSPKDLVTALRGERGTNTVLNLDVEGESTISVLLCDYQVHPVSRQVLHADFLRISADSPVEIDVPLELVGKAKGVAVGGSLRKIYRTLPVSCLPAQIPVRIEHDVTDLDIDAHVAVRDLALPEGVSVRLPAAQTVAALIAEKKVEAESTEGEEAGGEAAAATPATPK